MDTMKHPGFSHGHDYSPSVQYRQMLLDFLAPLAPIRSLELSHTSSTRYGIHRRGTAGVTRADKRDPWQIGKVTSTMAFFGVYFSGEKDETFHCDTLTSELGVTEIAIIGGRLQDSSTSRAPVTARGANLVPTPCLLDPRS